MLETEDLPAIHSACQQYDHPTPTHSSHKRDLRYQTPRQCWGSGLCIPGRSDERPSLARLLADGPLFGAQQGEMVVYKPCRQGEQRRSLECGKWWLQKPAFG